MSPMRIAAGILLALVSFEGLCAQSASIEDLSSMLEAKRAEHGLPALVGAVFDHEKILAEGVCGLRAAGEKPSATLLDLWHIGSITKSFTATLGAALVREEELEWDTPISDLLEAAEKTPFADVPWVHFAQHNSGMRANPDLTWFQSVRAAPGTSREQRMDIVGQMLKEGPQAPPKTRYEYSNAGFMTLGSALEELTGEDWEALIRSYIFAPLELKSGGFGPPGTPGRFEQPRGHQRGDDGTFIPVPAGPNGDNPQALGPAGTIHLSIRDLARWVKFIFAGKNGLEEFLSQESFQRLHRPGLGNYAMGWVSQSAPWANNERIVWHNGSNTSWYAYVAFIPSQNFGVALVSNGSMQSQTAIHELLAPLFKRFVDGD